MSLTDFSEVSYSAETVVLQILEQINENDTRF